MRPNLPVALQGGPQSCNGRTFSRQRALPDARQPLPKPEVRKAGSQHELYANQMPRIYIHMHTSMHAADLRVVIAVASIARAAAHELHVRRV